MDQWLLAPERFHLYVWLLAFFFAIHEAEEWNILGWYQRYFVELPPKTNKSIRTFLVFAALVGFVWAGAASIAGDPILAAWIMMPFTALVLLNALQHVFWLFYFRAFAPGVISSVVLLLPVCLLLGGIAVDQGLIPGWYAAIWIVPISIGLVQTYRSGNRLSSMFRVLDRVGRSLARRI
jgi:hypothetical protein